MGAVPTGLEWARRALLHSLYALFQRYQKPSQIALEKCTPENGALSFLPGSHLTTPITKRFVRVPGGGTGFEQLIPPNVENTIPHPEGKYILEACNPGETPSHPSASFLLIVQRRSCAYP
jgi:Phytanoyl-CoA dioxygenase (PhyH)